MHGNKPQQTETIDLTLTIHLPVHTLKPALGSITASLPEDVATSTAALLLVLGAGARSTTAPSESEKPAAGVACEQHCCKYLNCIWQVPA